MVLFQISGDTEPLGQETMGLCSGLVLGLDSSRLDRAASHQGSSGATCWQHPAESAATLYLYYINLTDTL